jgi:hypothetical protein
MNCENHYFHCFSFIKLRGEMCSFLDCKFLKFRLHNLLLVLHILVGLHA